MKKFKTGVMALLLCSIVSLSSYANFEAAIHPLDSGKEVLYYLFYTQEDKLENDVAELVQELQLSEAQLEQLKEIALRQHLDNKQIKQTYRASTRAGAEKFNSQVGLTAEASVDQTEMLLGKKEAAFRDWIKQWWTEEVSYRNKIIHSSTTRADIDKVSQIWATQYVPETTGSMEVALPDKYIKFANRGTTSNIPNEYKAMYSNPDYVVNVHYSAADKSLLRILVNENGPWNSNDNYWDEARREFADLDLGVPEAYEAYYNNYNDGKDDQGRTVLNPAGIDLSTEAASEIGFATANTSGWVIVRYEYLP